MSINPRPRRRFGDGGTCGVDGSIAEEGGGLAPARRHPRRGFSPGAEGDGGPSEEKRRGVAGPNLQGATLPPDDAPSQAVSRALNRLAKAAPLAIAGVFAPQECAVPIGLVRQRDVTVRAGTADHREHVADLVELTRHGSPAPAKVPCQLQPLTGPLETYTVVDDRQPGWTKVELDPAACGAPPAGPRSPPVGWPGLGDRACSWPAAVGLGRDPCRCFDASRPGPA